MAIPYQVGIKLEEESEQKQPDMHAIHIGIRGNHDIVIAQILKSLFKVERSLEQVELFIFVNNPFAQPEAVERFSLKAEYRLGVNIPGLGDRSAGRITLGDENG